MMFYRRHITAFERKYIQSCLNKSDIRQQIKSLIVTPVEKIKGEAMGHLYFVRHGETVWNVENKICGVYSGR